MDKVIRWLYKNGLLLCGVGVLLMIILWIIGYFLNGLCGKNFNIDSVWTGVGVLTGGGITGFGTQLWKYWIDSKHNSKSGEIPGQGVNGDV
jgi:hypothetical protein